MSGYLWMRCDSNDREGSSWVIHLRFAPCLRRRYFSPQIEAIADDAQFHEGYARGETCKRRPVFVEDVVEADIVVREVQGIGEGGHFIMSMEGVSLFLTEKLKRNKKMSRRSVVPTSRYFPPSLHPCFHPLHPLFSLSLTFLPYKFKRQDPRVSVAMSPLFSIPKITRCNPPSDPH